MLSKDASCLSGTSQKNFYFFKYETPQKKIRLIVQAHQYSADFPGKMVQYDTALLQ